MSTFPPKQSGQQSTPTENPIMNRHPQTGISIVIVGAGVGGIVTALESWRKGHQVRILERSPSPIETGDFFTVGPSAVRAFQNWPEMAVENERIAYDPWVAYHKHTGECFIPPGPMVWDSPDDAKVPGNTPTRIYRHHRPKFYQMLLKQLEKIGIQVEYSMRVVGYYEDETSAKGGVMLEDNSKIEGDVVVAADGLGTKSYEVIVGKKIEARSSGYAIYRTAYPVELALADTDVAERFKILENGKSVNEIWIGPDMHLFVWRSEDLMSWLLTHKDTGTAAESWHTHTAMEDVLKFTSQILGWPDIMNKVMRTTPRDGIIDFKLMWRDPQPQWTSPIGRVVQLGDAAHTFVPSSGNGATQAIEDAVSLTTCLQLGGKSNIPWAVKIHNKLRFERVSCCQKLGFVNQDSYNHTVSEAVIQDPNAVKAKYGKWIWSHDPEKYAYENYGNVFLSLVGGQTFKNTNIPPGLVYRPWTIDELLALEKEGKKIELDGDWS